MSLYIFLLWLKQVLITSYSSSTWNLRRTPIWPGCQHKNKPKWRNSWTYLAVYDSCLAPQNNSSDAAGDFHPSKWRPLCFGICHGWRNSPFFTNFHFYVRVLLLGKAEDFSWICAQAKDDILTKTWIMHSLQGLKVPLANSQNASDINNLRLRKISTSKRLRVRIIHVLQTFGKNLLVEKLSLEKLSKRTKKLTSSPDTRTTYHYMLKRSLTRTNNVQ